MSTADSDKLFAGSVPGLYQEYMVPMIFEPYAIDIVNRVAALSPSRVLEVACGTGVVTRRLASVLPDSTSIVATDLNQSMLDLAIQIGTERNVEWKQVDAMQLPFPDAFFDVVVCQFGAMFFPDKPTAFSEARRVLRPGGTLIFNVWDRIEENEFVQTANTVLKSIFPHDPPRFMVRTPHGYHDLKLITEDLKDGGFTASPEIHTVTARSTAASARHAAIAYCEGTPLRGEIDSRGPPTVDEVVGIVEEALAQRFGVGSVDGRIQAHVFSIMRSDR